MASEAYDHSSTTQQRNALLDLVEFNEELYVAIYPDVSKLIEEGDIVLGLEHYIERGRSEGRLHNPEYFAALGYSRMPRSPIQIPFSIDTAFVSESGIAFVVGWVDDRQVPLSSISIISGSEGCNTRAFGRCRRSDVERNLNIPEGHSVGFWTMVQLVPGQDLTGAWRVRVLLDSVGFAEAQTNARMVSDSELRNIVLGYFASVEYYGNRDIEAFQALESGLGRKLIQLNRYISSSITATAHVERFGRRDRHFKASIIVCLFGKHEFLFLQNALFSRANRFDDYEYVYVSNSPELSEVLHKEARIAERIYGISLTLVTLSGNAGFSAANNIAARYAISDRIIFVNPDVFPIDNGWAERHEGIIAGLPAEQTAIFGALLYYDDGSLMHGGMYFDIDRGLSIKPNSIVSRAMIRVEHHGKGSPASSAQYTSARPVPAITGAFISTDRSWFERLGGFSEDHLFGHYEDADLCLKSLAQGVPVWMHDIRFWHLEGKGSVRRHEHEGGSLVNRWLFTRNWGELIQAEIAGKTPVHRLLNPASESATGTTNLTTSGQPTDQQRSGNPKAVPPCGGAR
ncbi:hypothetical protein ACD578_27585 (plasmid) [Microvirga sp. RSM25]|uniref:hypothetical protein n=1 Tax=Microvirga sp. RSM25 TaxID=3273802 RepID=UPI00384BF1EE